MSESEPGVSWLDVPWLRHCANLFRLASKGNVQRRRKAAGAELSQLRYSQSTPSQHHSTLDIITFNCLLLRRLLHSSKESPRYKKRRSNVFKENVFVETFQEKSWIREWILEQSVSSSKLNQKALIKIQSHGDWRASGKDLLSSLGTYIALYF